MYKIYINGQPLSLMNTSELMHLQHTHNFDLQSRYSGKAKFLLNHIDLLEKTPNKTSVAIYANDLDTLWKDFKSIYRIIKAAGGLVYNPYGDVLAIFRRGFWDLPKGKIDKGEKKKAAARREVMEETGLSNVVLEHKLINTYHTYRHPQRKDRILKKTYWYQMSAQNEILSPQSEEDIEQAIWLPSNELKSKDPIYPNICDVLNA